VDNSVTNPGQIVILNGAPRSGKSSIAAAIQETFADPWLNLGVDVWVRHVTPARHRPGIGLRPGGERPDLEDFVEASYAALYDSIAASSRQGINVVVDVGHHDSYSRPRNILARCAKRLEGLPVLFVGVRCPLDVIMQRRDAGQPGREGVYATSPPSGEIPAPVQRWQDEVHKPGIYDLEVDTSVMSPEECAAAIHARLTSGPGTAFQKLAEGSG
jgi:chloramphenicol 3-O phosphotransferase